MHIYNRSLKKYGVNNGLVCELGCGTGEVTERLADSGYDMIGIDNSYEMLEVANEKSSIPVTNPYSISCRT